MKSELEQNVLSEVRNGLTNGICGLGGYISNLEFKLQKKSISKKEIRLIIIAQRECLKLIENSKNNIVKLID